MYKTLDGSLKFTVLAAVMLLVSACESTTNRAPVRHGSGGGTVCPANVTVYSGDTVYGVARRCQVSVREIIDANKLAVPYVLQPGQVLRIPGGNVYTVQRGDTLLLVARRHGVDFKSLARMNNKSDPYTIYVGEKLRLPGGENRQTAHASGQPTGTATTSTGALSTGGMVISSPHATGSYTSSTPVSQRKPLTDPVMVEKTTSEPLAERGASAQQQAAFEPARVIQEPPSALSGKGFAWPVKGKVISTYGPIAKGQHNDGINIAAARGTMVRSSENGVVAYVGNDLKGFGNLLLIKHDGGWITAYAHVDQILVKKGEVVQKGQRIATVGATGSVESPQLHFELRKGTEAVDPTRYLSGQPL